MKIYQDDRGQVVIMTALAIPVLIGFLALAVDIGVLFVAKRNVQIAADAAAMGAAMDYLYNGSVTSAQNAGQADAVRNGFTNGVGGVGVTINCPPTSGPNTGGGASFCEAILTQPNNVFSWAFSAEVRSRLGREQWLAVQRPAQAAYMY